jgi:transmembrane sensor
MDDLEEPPQNEIDRTATAWVVRLTSGQVTAEDRAAARAWAESSPRHRTAFERARTLWQLGGALAPAPAPRRHLRRWAAAAVVAALAVGLSLMLPPHWQADYRSGTAEVRKVVLGDGSTALLDAQSAIDVDFRGNLRRVELLQGEALFDVRSDPARPFEVHGLDVSATAKGTLYSVRHHDTRVEVLVAEGSVAVESGHTQPLLLRPGQRARYEAGRLLALEEDVDMASALAWRDGRLVFELAPLAEVVAALNRHRRGHIAVADDRLEQLPVSGVFQLNRLDEALDTLAQALPVHSLHVTDHLVILY